jgi:hypothetical protein
MVLRNPAAKLPNRYVSDGVARAKVKETSHERHDQIQQ